MKVLNLLTSNSFLRSGQASAMRCCSSLINVTPYGITRGKQYMNDPWTKGNYTYIKLLSMYNPVIVLYNNLHTTKCLNKIL